MIWKISSKTQPSALKHLTKSKTEATSKKDIADILAETISANSSFDNSNPQFFTFKSNAEKQRLNFKSNNSENTINPLHQQN